MDENALTPPCPIFDTSEAYAAHRAVIGGDVLDAHVLAMARRLISFAKTAQADYPDAKITAIIMDHGQSVGVSIRLKPLSGHDYVPSAAIKCDIRGFDISAMRAVVVKLHAAVQ